MERPSATAKASTKLFARKGRTWEGVLQTSQRNIIMNARIQKLKQTILDGAHHCFRHTLEWNLADDFAQRKEHPAMRRALALEAFLSAETPQFLPDERIAFLRTVANLPRLFTDDEMAAMKKEHSFSEQGVPFNFTPDYPYAIAKGLDALRAEVDARLGQAVAEGDREGEAFLAAGIRSIDAVLELSDRYCREARSRGLNDIAETLAAVPHSGAKTMLQAMQAFRILHYTLWCEGEYHNGIGRLDQWLYPYYKHDIEQGVITREEAFELLEEFFLTFNRDSDLYIGVQQGDNGQSLMIGGCDRDGNDSWNDLSTMILEASCELKLIDPKINFRVNRNTPMERLELGARLTRAGLGFPQYSNDDVVIPALEKWGYAPEDARDYTVAACWEFVIPAVCHEFVNLDAVSIPEVLLDTLKESKALTGNEFRQELRQNFRKTAVGLLEKYKNLSVLPSPFISMLCPVAIQKARNITEAGKYHNWGFHGSGFSVAADSLAALDAVVFERHEMTTAQFYDVLLKNFKDAPDLLAEVRNSAPKLGRNAPKADNALRDIVEIWQHAWDGLKNAQGGIIRPGTGSAMYYIWHSQNLMATPDGRQAGEPFSANYAPSLDVPVDGPLSVVRSFTTPDMTGVCNGGPLTIELHNSVFSDPKAETKVAALIADFVRRGGHQLQLNSINRDTLLDAQKHPENYRNLIVRVWGWSGYFVELDKVYQDHIIRRAEMPLYG